MGRWIKKYEDAVRADVRSDGGTFVRLRLIFPVLMAATAFSSGTLPAQELRPSLADSFRLGSGGGALCQAQSRATDPAVQGMFDRAWTLVCRDAAQPVGQLYALRDGGGGLEARLAAARRQDLSCGAPANVQVADVGAVTSRQCQLTAARLGYVIHQYHAGKVTYVAQGLASYDSALQLALRTIVADKPVDGQIAIAISGTDDPAAFARLQAGTLDPETSLAEGYRRNNSGNYAEAAEFFDSLQEQFDESDAAKLSPAEREARQHEYLVNRALQLSNLSEFGQADALFAQAGKIATRDRVQLRLRRNFQAMHKLNQREYGEAAAILDRSVLPTGVNRLASSDTIELSPQLAAEINSSATGATALGVSQDTRLTPNERAAIIDAQASQLRGTLLRLKGQPREARAMLEKALSDAMVIRGGRVTSITRLRAQLVAEMALTHEAEGNAGAAENMLREALKLLSTQYPETAAMNGARARLAAFLVRRQRKDEALALYREIVGSTAANRASVTGLANQLQPYFELLAADIPAHPESSGSLFLASQLLVRPGAADTMEVLSRELQAGDGEAARLFRQSVSLSRDIERRRIELAQLIQTGQQDASAAPLIEAARNEIEDLGRQQVETQAALAAYPQYRAVSREAVTLDELRSALKPGEAYLKMVRAGNALFAVYADGAGATGYRLPISSTELERKVNALRETISTVVGGVQTTYPFDVELARSIYLDLFGPVGERLEAVTHLIFEPDGAMLRLPANLLVTEQAGVDAYLQRLEDPNADEFDFRGIKWLGRGRAISTALSVRGFRDARLASSSRGTRSYLGLGQNAPVAKVTTAALTRSAAGAPDEQCQWPLDEWNRPIAATELRQAASILGPSGTEIVTGTAFTDSAIMARSDLRDYRVLHFATHGLVTPPRSGCPARPALLTSFGTGNSDGLLNFAEIFDLKLDADLVILSACDTAGQASKEATRAAGLGTGGGTALDGLVRAFIGAGGRAIIASHWPAPDDYNATERLIGGLFGQGTADSIGTALQKAQVPLMDSAETSHPFYWSGFAIVGDGARPLFSR